MSTVDTVTFIDRCLLKAYRLPQANLLPVPPKTSGIKPIVTGDFISLKSNTDEPLDQTVKDQAVATIYDGRPEAKLVTDRAHLQTLMHKDPAGYTTEFRRQVDHFAALVAVVSINLVDCQASNCSQLVDLIRFLSHTAHLFVAHFDVSGEICAVMSNLLTKTTSAEAQSLAHVVRLRSAVAHALVVFTRHGLIKSVDLLGQLFSLVTIPDRHIRTFVRDQTVAIIRKMPSVESAGSVERALLYRTINGVTTDTVMPSKVALDVLIRLCRRHNVWNNAQTVNIIAHACFVPINKIRVTAMRFFLRQSGDDPDDIEDYGDEQSKSTPLPSIKAVVTASKVAKKTAKRQKMVDSVKKAYKRQQRKLHDTDCLETSAGRGGARGANFSAIHLVHDPQVMAERLFKFVQSEAKQEKFELRLMTIDLVSRLIGVHELIVLPFYSFMARLLKPHQSEVVRLLQFVAQATHSLIPPDVLESVVDCIMTNFVAECFASEVNAVGLNAIRAIAVRCNALCLDSVRMADLTSFRAANRDKAVTMAVKGLAHSVVDLRPDIVPKRHKGRPVQAHLELDQLSYGHSAAKTYIAGAECLDDDCAVSEVQSAAESITSSRVLTDDDFNRIRMNQARKAVQAFRKGSKRKRQASESDDEVDDAVDDADTTLVPGRDELVNLADIEMVHAKKRRQTKEQRLQSIADGREDRPKFGSKRYNNRTGGSTTNREKTKAKTFAMVKHKLQAGSNSRVRGKRHGVMKKKSHTARLASVKGRLMKLAARR